MCICRYKVFGIRLDFGDLLYFFIEIWCIFWIIEEEFNVFGFGKLVIVVSSDINEGILDVLNK